MVSVACAPAMPPSMWLRSPPEGVSINIDACGPVNWTLPVMVTSSRNNSLFCPTRIEPEPVIVSNAMPTMPPPTAWMVPPVLLIVPSAMLSPPPVVASKMPPSLTQADGKKYIGKPVALLASKTPSLSTVSPPVLPISPPPEIVLFWLSSVAELPFASTKSWSELDPPKTSWPSPVKWTVPAISRLVAVLTPTRAMLPELVKVSVLLAKPSSSVPPFSALIKPIEPPLISV